MDVVFLGSGAFGVPTLEWLAATHRVRGIVTQPDRPAGRGGKLTPTPVAAWAAERLPGVEIVKPERVNLPEVVERVRAWPASAWVVIAFGQKLSSRLLEGRLAMNLHASILPRWRGAAPIHAAVVAGDERIGNSVITLAERMDAGLVLAQSGRALDPDVTSGEWHDLLAAEGPTLIGSVLEEHARGTLRGVAQDESLVTLAKKLGREDGWVDFREGAPACRRRINGLSPWPGVTVRVRGIELKLLRATAVGPIGGNVEAGTLADAGSGVVRCGDGNGLRLLEVQPAGKRVMGWEEFARGARLEGGERVLGKEAGA